MTTTELIERMDACDGVHKARDGGLGELGPLIGAVPGAGPPIILLTAPLVLFALALTGPFLLLLTLVVLLVACVFLVALVGAIVASPYLLVRRLGRHRRAQALRSAPAARFVPVAPGGGRA